MQAGAFDGIARALGGVSTRRGVFRLLGGAAAFGTGLALGGDSLAKRKHRGSAKAAAPGGVAKKKKACRPCTKRTKGKCKPTMNGTGCTGGTCQHGTCVATAGALPKSPGCGQGGPCRVFLSSTLHSGVLGGLNGADAICQGLATNAGLPGQYKAWLSDATSAPSARFVPSSGPYQLVDGTTIADNWTDLTDGALLGLITVTETGGGIGSTQYAWTGTLTNGNARGDNQHCQNWSGGANAVGAIGTAMRVDVKWTEFASGTNCNTNFLHLYCFQQR